MQLSNRSFQNLGYNIFQLKLGIGLTYYPFMNEFTIVKWVFLSLFQGKWGTRNFSRIDKLFLKFLCGLTMNTPHHEFHIAHWFRICIYYIIMIRTINNVLISDIHLQFTNVFYRIFLAKHFFSYFENERIFNVLFREIRVSPKWKNNFETEKISVDPAQLYSIGDRVIGSRIKKCDANKSDVNLWSVNRRLFCPAILWRPHRKTAYKRCNIRKCAQRTKVEHSAELQIKCSVEQRQSNFSRPRVTFEQNDDLNYWRRLSHALSTLGWHNLSIGINTNDGEQVY